MALTTDTLLARRDQSVFDAQVVLDSVNRHGARMITMKWTIWRPVLAEVNTHKMLSKNAPSSRAMSVTKLLGKIQMLPAMPIWWGQRDGPGMQAFTELSDADKERAKEIWFETRDMCVQSAKRLESVGLHQQVANRIVESWMATTIVISGTQWANLFAQRVHFAAQPEFHIVAAIAQESIKNSIPVLMPPNEWHLPFISSAERDKYYTEHLIQAASARCARASYFQFDGNYDFVKDIDLYERLWHMEPPHASPFEHIAQNMDDVSWYANLRGWRQRRKDLPNENVMDEFYDGPTLPYESLFAKH